MDHYGSGLGGGHHSYPLQLPYRLHVTGVFADNELQPLALLIDFMDA